MKYFLLLLPLLIGCTDYRDKSACENNLRKCQLVNEHNLRTFGEQCKKLADCMKSDYEVVHLLNQSDSPYTCSITKSSKSKKHPQKNRYFYPMARLDFGEAYFDSFDNAIRVCELMTETGEFADSHYDALDAQWKRFQEQKKAEQKEQEKEKHLPKIKIREEQ